MLYDSCGVMSKQSTIFFFSRTPPKKTSLRACDFAKSTKLGLTRKHTPSFAKTRFQQNSINKSLFFSIIEQYRFQANTFRLDIFIHVVCRKQLEDLWTQFYFVLQFKSHVL